MSQFNLIFGNKPQTCSTRNDSFAHTTEIIRFISLTITCIIYDLKKRKEREKKSNSEYTVCVGQKISPKRIFGSMKSGLIGWFVLNGSPRQLDIDLNAVSKRDSI